MDVQRLRELFCFNPLTGELTRRVPAGKARAGAACGTPHTAGYLQVRVDGKWQYVHRVCWAIATGLPPPEVLDHINGNPTDNRMVNLRLATHAQNMQNHAGQKRRKSPYKGVRSSPTAGKWVARITVNGEEKYLGTFDTAEAARDAYVEAAKQHHSHAYGGSNAKERQA